MILSWGRHAISIKLGVLLAMLVYYENMKKNSKAKIKFILKQSSESAMFLS